MFSLDSTEEDEFNKDDEFHFLIRTDGFAQLIRAVDLEACQGWPWAIKKKYKDCILLTAEKATKISRINICSVYGSDFIERIVNFMNSFYAVSIKTSPIEADNFFDFIKLSIKKWATQKARVYYEVIKWEKLEEQDDFPQFLRDKPSSGGWGALLAGIDQAKTVEDIFHSLKIYKYDVEYREVAEAVEYSVSCYNGYGK